MELSIESYILRERFGDDVGLKMIKDAGFNLVDVSYYWCKKDYDLLGDNYVERSKELRKLLDDIGLKCNQAHAPFDFGYGQVMDDTNKNYKEIVRAIISASILGAEHIVVHSIGYSKDGEFLFDKDYNIRFYRSFLPILEKYNIKIAVENLFFRDKDTAPYKGRLGSPKELTDFVKELNSPYFVACVDVGHSAIVGVEPEDFISKMDNKTLKCLHIQDGDYLEDRHVLPYMGEFKWDKVLKALKDIGYDGELTFEVWRFLHKAPKELTMEALKYANSVGNYMIEYYKNI